MLCCKGFIADGFSLGNVDGFHIAFLLFLYSGGVCLPFFFWYSGSPLLTQTDGQYQRKIAAFLRLDHDGGVNAAELEAHLRFLPKLF